MGKDKKKFQLPFVSRKLYDIAKNNYKVAMEGQSKLRELYIKYQTESRKELKEQEEKYKENYNSLLTTNSMICERLDHTEWELAEAKENIRYLKRLLTMNNIAYKKIQKRRK